MKTSLLITIAASLLLFGCSQERVVDYLQERNDGLSYAVNEEEPFTGKHVIYYENGKKLEETNYKDGEWHGLRTEWYENGQKQSEENFKNGKLHGLRTGWYEWGKKKSEANWKDGEAVERLCCD